MKKRILTEEFAFLNKSKLKAADGKASGVYPFYTSSEILSKYTDNPIYPAGCLVFGTGGKPNIHLANSPFSTSGDCLVITPLDLERIDIDFIYIFFISNMRVLEKGFKGAGLKHISKDYISKIELPVPLKVNQNRIATLLGRVEALITTRKNNLQQLDDFLKSTFLEMFGDPVRNEKEWETIMLEKLCEQVVDCPHSTPKYSDENTGYYCVRSGDIVDGYLNLGKTFEVERGVYEERIHRYKPHIGDIVYSREGGRLGNAARILESDLICLGQRIMLFKTNEENSADFLWALLESRPFKTKIQSLVGGGAAPRVNIKDLKKIVVIKPPTDMQIGFSRITERVDQIKRLYQKSLNDLENLYGALSQKAFKGELDLSHIPLTESKEEEKERTETVEMNEDAIKEIEKIMLDPIERESFLRHFFDTYINENPGKVVNLDEFWSSAELYLPNENDDPVYIDEADQAWGQQDYDHVKKWIFELLQQGKLEQVFKKDEVQASNSKIELMIKE